MRYRTATRGWIAPRTFHHTRVGMRARELCYDANRPERACVRRTVTRGRRCGRLSGWRGGPREARLLVDSVGDLATRP